MYPSGSCSAPVGVPSYSYCECPVVSLADGEYEDGVLEGWAASWWFCGRYAEGLWGTIAAGEVLGVAGGDEVSLLSEGGCGVCECEEGSDDVSV